jgi:hypothetical protein
VAPRYGRYLCRFDPRPYVIDFIGIVTRTGLDKGQA